MSWFVFFMVLMTGLSFRQNWWCIEVLRTKERLMVPVVYRSSNITFVLHYGKRFEKRSHLTHVQWQWVRVASCRDGDNALYRTQLQIPRETGICVQLIEATQEQHWGFWRSTYGSVLSARKPVPKPAAKWGFSLSSSVLLLPFIFVCDIDPPPSHSKSSFTLTIHHMYKGVWVAFLISNFVLFT